MSKKISELTAVASLAGTEYVPVVQGGVTMRANASMFGSGSGNITVDCEIGVAYVSSGAAAITGLSAGSSAITSTDFANKKVRITRGGFGLPRTAPTNGDAYATKTLVSGTINLSSALTTGEYIMIETI